MTAKIIDGVALAKSIRSQAAQRADRCKSQGRPPGLTVILVGDNPASQVYVRNKVKACEEVGIRSQLIQKPQQNTNYQHVPSADFKQTDAMQLKEGQRVEHQKFGFGTVGLVEGSAHNPIATIHFEKNGEKKIMLNYAKLRIVE